MRKILTLPRNGLAALRRATCGAPWATFGICLAVTFCLSTAARAQTLSRGLAPTAMSMQDGPVSTAGAANLSDAATVNAAYSVLSDQTQVEQASFRGRVNPAYCPPSANACNPNCDISWYFNYDALWLRRENDERFSLSRNTFIPDFEYEFGGRYTAGRMLDCSNGWEAVYVGPYDWQRSASVAGTGNLQSQLQPLNGYTAAEVSSFNSADQHAQAYRAQLNSFEFNRRWWVWDVVSTMIGVRYVDYEEDFLFFSQRTGVGNGLFVERVDNQLVGVQTGADLIYPISLRANVGVRAKAGVYANFDERETFLSNAGTIVLNAGDSDVDVAGIIEYGVFANYHVVPSVRLTAGYEFWYLPGMATIPEQSPTLVSPASGTTVFDSDDLFLHGGSVGVQILY